MPLGLVWLALRGHRRAAGGLLVGFVVTILPWLVGAWLYFGSPVPTTFEGKANTTTWANGVVVGQTAEVLLTGLGPATVLALVAGVVVAAAGGLRRLGAVLGEQWLLLAWPLGLVAFYYVKTPGLQSPGR